MNGVNQSQSFPMPNNPNQFDNSYMKFRIDNVRLIKLINKRLGGIYYENGKLVRRTDANVILSEWAVEQVLSIVEPYSDTSFVLTDFDKYTISELARKLYEDLYLVLLENLRNTGLRNQFQLMMVVDIIIDVVFANMRKSKDARMIMSDKTQVNVLEENRSSNNVMPVQQTANVGKTWR